MHLKIIGRHKNRDKPREPTKNHRLRADFSG